MTNEELTAAVRDELTFDPKLDHANVAVSADDGIVTLRGTVGAFHEKREAAKAAERVYGTTSVDNKIDVELMVGSDRKDAELRADLLQALMLNSIVPSSVDADVHNGYVTLTGTADWDYQRVEAERIAGTMRGVIDVDDEIELTGIKPDVEDVQHDIKKALERNAKLDAKGITVETSDHTVTLKGTVPSWVEHDEAVTAAWSAPGVQKVHDRLIVAY